jgi:hypothetical protein
MFLSPAALVHRTPVLHAPKEVRATCAKSSQTQRRRIHCCSSDSGSEFTAEIDYDVREEDPAWKDPIKVAVSGAAGQICNHLLFMLASGEVFGNKQPIQLRLLGSERSREALEGVAMELEDSLYPLLRSVKIGIEPEVVFKDADWALLVGAKPRGPGMERADLLDLNGQVFEKQGKALDQVRYASSWIGTRISSECIANHDSTPVRSLEHQTKGRFKPDADYLAP